jgi:histidinol-phosphate/aromatic aminotransferase/cobyric acid decarboxylase-like protein
MSGMRAATIMSRNPSVIAALRAVSPFHNINVITDAILTKFLSDSTQLKKFILDNLTSINENYSRLSQFLLDNNIPFKRANSGFFVFADLGMFLGDEKLWIGRLGCMRRF